MRQFTLDLVIERDGTTEGFESKDNTAGGTSTAKALAGFFGVQLEQLPGRKHRVVDDALIVEGWTDPKTKTFYPVKAIRFASPNLPKEAFPVITVPRKKA